MNGAMVRICLALTALTLWMLAGCGSSVTNKTSPSGQAVSLVAASSEFPNAGLLVTADSLQASLGKAGLVIIDARSTAAYAAGHIPGAINLQHSAFWTKGSGLKTTATVVTQLGAAGIARDSKIVIYDNTVAA